MEKFEFKSAICTSVEQSKRLLELGLKKETADMVWIKELAYDEKNHYTYDAETYMLRPLEYLGGESHRGHLPAWSLHRLIEIVPKQVKTPKPTYGWAGEDLTFRIDDDLYIQYEDWGIENEEYRFCGKGFYNSNLYDNIIECIEWLIKEGYFNKDYLEEKK